MIAVSQEGEQAGACLMSRVTVLIDCGSRGVAPVCSNDPSWFLHIAFFNYIKCSALVTANLGTHRLSLRIQERSIHYAHYIMHGKQRNTSLLWYQSRWLQQPTIFSWKKKKCSPLPSTSLQPVLTCDQLMLLHHLWDVLEAALLSMKRDDAEIRRWGILAIQRGAQGIKGVLSHLNQGIIFIT